MARIVIDRFVGSSGRVEAELCIHTEVAPWNKVEHPTIPGQIMDVKDFLVLLNAQPALRGAAGYNDVCIYPGAPPGLTRWHHLQDAGVVPGVPAVRPPANPPKVGEGEKP